MRKILFIAEKEEKKATNGSENVDMDLMHDVLDHYNSAREKIHEFDPEMEAFISAHLGRIYYLGFRNNKKAKKYYRDSLRLLETLKENEKILEGERTLWFNE